MMHREDLEALAVRAAEDLKARIGGDGIAVVILSSEEPSTAGFRVELTAVYRGGEIGALRCLKWGVDLIEAKILGKRD